MKGAPDQILPCSFLFPAALQSIQSLWRKRSTFQHLFKVLSAKRDVYAGTKLNRGSDQLSGWWATTCYLYKWALLLHQRDVDVMERCLFLLECRFSFFGVYGTDSWLTIVINGGPTQVRSRREPIEMAPRTPARPHKHLAPITWRVMEPE